MARPTDEIKNHVVKCRIGDDLYSKINGNVSDVIRNALESFVTQNENNDRGFVTQNDLGLSDADIESLKDIQVMCAFFDVELSDFIQSLQEKMNEGDISVERGQIILGNPYMTEVLKDDEVVGILHNLESLCEDKGVDLFEAYKNALIIGAKIAYKDVQGA